MMFTTCVDVIAVVCTALPSLVHLSVVMTMNWLPALVLGVGPEMSVYTNSRKPAGENIFKFI